MPYKYEEVRHALFTDDGQRLFLRVRDNVLAALEASRAIRADAPRARVGVEDADAWEFHACFDRMIELEELREVSHPDVFLQNRIFVKRGA